MKRVGPPTLGLRLFAGVTLLAFALYAVHLAVGLGAGGFARFIDDGVYNFLLLAGAVICFWRAAAGGRERLAWLFLGLGMVSWLGGNVHWTIFMADLKSPPFPSVGDAMYLGFDPSAT